MQAAIRLSFSTRWTRTFATFALCASLAPTYVFAADLPDVCGALKHIIATPNFTTLRAQPAMLPPGAPGQGECRASQHSYDCHWKAHWEADGVVADPLQELGADIASCFPDVVHDVNTANRQHFVVRGDEAHGRVSVSASVDGPSALRLRIVR